MRFLWIVLLFAQLCACSSSEPIYNTQNYVFGTMVDISIYGEPEASAQAASQEIIQTFQSLHHRLHAWQPSEITAINQAFTQGKAVAIQPDVAAMIQQATTFSEQSHGAFNPAIGHLITLWGFHNDEFKPVTIDASELKKLTSANPQMSDIIIKDGMAFSKNPAVQLDLGGYAKGYALDVALNILEKHGINNALINIGGNIIALGLHGDKPWRVGIQHPRRPMAIATLDLPSGWAIGTSGDYQRYFELNGKRYCHIIDPATGYPVQNMQSVTVLIPPGPHAGTLSDVASKPIFIASTPSARMAAASTMGLRDFLMIESADHIQISESMRKKLTWLDKDAEHSATVVQP
jgi:FAD:protein FMN transferase